MSNQIVEQQRQDEVGSAEGMRENKRDSKREGGRF